jgi:hypothetical protein
MTPNARVQRADDEALKYALYPYRSRCNEMLGDSPVESKCRFKGDCSACNIVIERYMNSVLAKHV